MLKIRIVTIILRKRWYTHPMRYIGLQLRFQDSYDLAVAHGVVHYAQKKSGWRIKGPLFSDSLADCDALIARIESEEEARAYRAASIPIVDIANATFNPFFHLVTNDDIATGEIAGAYCKEAGLDALGWCGIDKVRWAAQRFKGFSKGLHVPKESIHSFIQSLSWWRQLYESSEEFDRWLKGLPKPIALFCGNDLSAVKTLFSCQRLEIAVPEEVMLLGVDNETLLCELASPSISSIQPNCHAIGYEAAALIDRLLSGGQATLAEQTILPLPIIERESTAIIHAGDEHVARALKLIKAEATYGLGAGEVAAESAISRRALEMRFQKYRGRTILAEIQHQRLAEATRLLLHTSTTIKEVAYSCGFASEHRFYALFRKAYGMTPGEYRALHHPH